MHFNIKVILILIQDCILLGIYYTKIKSILIYMLGTDVHEHEDASQCFCSIWSIEQLWIWGTTWGICWTGLLLSLILPANFFYVWVLLELDIVNPSGMCVFTVLSHWIPDPYCPFVIGNDIFPMIVIHFSFLLYFLFLKVKKKMVS